MFQPHSPSPLPLLIENTEVLLGTMQQNTQIIAAYAEFPANIILILLLQENSAEDLAVLFRQLRQHVPHLLPRLLRYQHPIQINAQVRGIARILIEGEGAGG